MGNGEATTLRNLLKDGRLAAFLSCLGMSWRGDRITITINSFSRHLSLIHATTINTSGSGAIAFLW